ncbi:hypothetical protein MD484_g3000, partial [Candolleomyces efflorescens]
MSIAANTTPYSGLPPINVRLFEAKARKGEFFTIKGKACFNHGSTGLSFADIGKVIDRDEVWVAAAFYAQAKFTTEEIIKVSELLGIGHVDVLNALGPHWWPDRGLVEMPPRDPVLYRLYEGIMVYGQPIKVSRTNIPGPFAADVLNHSRHDVEVQFGDGIMSMINCNVHVDKKEDPAGDRVVLTFDGKFLPYSQW